MMVDDAAMMALWAEFGELGFIKLETTGADVGNEVVAPSVCITTKDPTPVA